MSMYPCALVVGRFQPFHKGHLHLLQYALERADEVIIAIGSSNVYNVDNPLDYETRKNILETVIQTQGWKDRVKTIVPTPDFPQDQAWQEYLVRTVASISSDCQVVIGNNDWTNQILASVGYTVVTLPDLDRTLYQATFIRDAIRKNAPWEDRVPDYLIAQIQQLDFSTSKNKTER